MRLETHTPTSEEVSMETGNPSRLSRREFVLGGSAAIAGMTLATVLGATSAEAAGPITAVYQGRRRSVLAPAKTFDLVNMVQDFAPTAYLGWHSHDFPVFILVLDGEAAFRSGSSVMYYRTGRTIQCGPGLHTMGNDRANSTMRRFVTLLNPPGLPATVAGAGPAIAARGAAPAKGPSTVHPMARGTVTEAPARFDFSQALFRLEPDAVSAPYKSSGYSAWTVITGEVAVTVGGTATDYSAGGFFLLTPGQSAVVANSGAQAADLAVSMVVESGAPLSTLA
jgi:quercetin dioxygenase-like cupin family protein